MQPCNKELSRAPPSPALFLSLSLYTVVCFECWLGRLPVTLPSPLTPVELQPLKPSMDTHGLHLCSYCTVLEDSVIKPGFPSPILTLTNSGGNPNLSQDRCVGRQVHTLMLLLTDKNMLACDDKPPDRANRCCRDLVFPERAGRECHVHHTHRHVLHKHTDTHRFTLGWD